MTKTLVEHAQFELERADLINNPDPQARKVATDTIALVKRFEKQAHDQTTGKWVLEFFQNLCYFKPLTPLTDDPAEWEKFEIEKKNTETKEVEVSHRWQSRRAPSVISEDEGKTWYDMATEQSGTSLDHVEEAKKREEDRKKSAENVKKREAKAKAAAEKTDKESSADAKTSDTTSDEAAPADDKAS